jgi:hypothetical protein
MYLNSACVRAALRGNYMVSRDAHEYEKSSQLHVTQDLAPYGETTPPMF